MRLIDCQAVREVNLDAKQFFIDYRLTAILLGLTAVNIVLRYIQTGIVPKLSAYKHHSPETNEEISVRFLQLFVGPIVAFFGYGFLLFNAISGCNSSEIYIFYIGGFLLTCLDTHEYVRRWPLRAPVLGHHIMVFFFALAFLEFLVLPPKPTDPISWSTVLVISNIGVMWCTDFFHVIFRVSMDLPLIERMKKVYLVLATIRPITFCLFLYGTVSAALEGSYVGAIPVFLMSLAYAYNSYKAITFVIHFDCKEYFLRHQAKWAVEQTEGLHTIDVSKRLISIRSNIQLDRRSSRFSMRPLETMFAIDVEDVAADLQRGLGGDLEVGKELENSQAVQGV